MSVSSMTAFARETASTPTPLTIELRSVNHRYLDCHFKLPDSLRGLEPRLRDALARRFKRGKIDCFMRQGATAAGAELEIDSARLDALSRALKTLEASSPQLAPPDSLALLQFPGVLREESEPEAGLHNAAFDLFERALQSLEESRAREGAQLLEFLQQRLEAVTLELGRVRDSLPELRERQRERLRRRLEELEQPVDEGRLEQELALLLLRADVDEELDRLDAHLQEMTRILGQGGPCGRRLDFLMQELNREANTLSSKSTASTTTQSAVELKVLIEQMREQIQNIE